MPFAVLGGFLFIAAGITYFVLPSHDGMVYIFISKEKKPIIITVVK